MSPERIFNPDAEKFSEKLYAESFLLQVIKRSTLNEFARALNEGELEKATGCAVSDPFGLGHEIDQLRIEDIFRDYPDRVALENAKELYSVALKAFGVLIEKERNGEFIDEEELRHCLDEARNLYDHLEKMITPYARKQFIDRNMREVEEWIRQNPNSLELEEVEREFDLLQAARERL